MRRGLRVLIAENIKEVQALIEIIKRKDIVRAENHMIRNKAKDNINMPKNLYGFLDCLGALKENKFRHISPIKHQGHFQ